MNRDSNAYTFIFATLMVLVVASALAFTASSLKDLQAANVRKEKMQNILATIGVQTDREQAEEKYKEYITAALSLTAEGTIDQQVNAFEINLNNELKKPVAEQRFPLYEANVEGNQFFIVPLIFCTTNFAPELINLWSDPTVTRSKPFDIIFLA